MLSPEAQAEFANRIILTRREVEQDIIKVSDQIARFCIESEVEFDALVVIPRGGLEVANGISRRLGLEATQILSFAISRYEGVEKTQKFRRGQRPDAELVQGQRLLVVDEVCDEAQTLQEVYRCLRKDDAALVMTAVLHDKPTRHTVDFQPDFFAWTTDRWIEYPWEKHDRHGKKWRQRLTQLGRPVTGRELAS